MVKLVFDQARCKGCELCSAVCPKKIIYMEKHFNAKGFRPAAVAEMEKCVACAACAKICPDAAIEIYREEE